MIIRRLNQNDGHLFKQMVELFEKVFEEENSSPASLEYLIRLLKNNHFFAIATIVDGQVIGGLTAHKLSSYYRELPEIFIYDIAISPVYQRKGIGRKLIHAINKIAINLGADSVWVDADEEDTHALDFYRSTGATESPVVQFTYKLK